MDIKVWLRTHANKSLDLCCLNLVRLLAFVLTVNFKNQL